MKVRLVKRQTIIKYTLKNSNSRIYFEDWMNKLKYADWDVPNDIKQTFNSADLMGDATSRVIFNIGGNNYRMICSYHFGKKNVHLFINWLGTHSEYDKLCDQNLQYTINKY